MNSEINVHGVLLTFNELGEVKNKAGIPARDRPARRARQSVLIHQWKPWERSTGPRTSEGKARAATNAYMGGERPLMRALAKVMRRQRETLG